MQIAVPHRFRLHPMQIAVPHWFGPRPMQIAVPLPAWAQQRTASAAAALPTLTANCNRK
jgi:hypothetical protein